MRRSLIQLVVACGEWLWQHRVATATVVLLAGGCIFALASDWNPWTKIGLLVIVAGSFLAALAIGPKSLPFESRVVEVPLYLGFFVLAVAAGLWIFWGQDPAMRLALSALLLVGLSLMIWKPTWGIVVLVFVALFGLVYGLYYIRSPSTFQPAPTGATFACSTVLPSTALPSTAGQPTPGQVTTASPTPAPTPPPIGVLIHYPTVMDPDSSGAVVLSLVAARAAMPMPTPPPRPRGRTKDRPSTAQKPNLTTGSLRPAMPPGRDAPKPSVVEPPTSTPQQPVCPTLQPTPKGTQTAVEVQATPIAVGTPGKDLRAAFGPYYDDLSAVPGLHAVQFKSVPLNEAGESAMEQQTSWGWTVTPKNSGQQVISVEIDGIWSCVAPRHCEKRMIKRRIWESALTVEVNQPPLFAPGQIMFTLLPALIPAGAGILGILLKLAFDGGVGRGTPEEKL